MTEETKEQALDKLSKFRPHIGYPTKWRDYGRLEIAADDLTGNVMRVAGFELDRSLSKIGQPIDREEWLMTLQTVNAYYHPLKNEIVFPAAILQPPFFNEHADDAVNYGGIGAVIGHDSATASTTRARPVTGTARCGTGGPRRTAKRSSSGLPPWSTSSTRSSRARLPVIGSTASSPSARTSATWVGSPLPSRRSRSPRTVPSRPRLDGYRADQRLFLSWGSVWQTKIRTEMLLQRLATDPHAPAEFRCNQFVRNLPEFYQAFGVTESDALWLDGDQRVKIW